MEKIRVGIHGYGNLGRGLEWAIKQNPDFQLEGIFTRRNPKDLSIISEGTPVVSVNAIESYVGKLDVLVLCGGSATDLPVQTPEMARLFNVVDSFDVHKDAGKHFANVDKAARETGHLGLISAGWDPGLFSVNRLYGEAILAESQNYTFWGKGVSQGHSDAARRIEGVADARQYTIPIDKALEAVRSGSNPELSSRERHLRECFVVLKEGADPEAVREAICKMPNFYADYDTTVHFISKEEMAANHSAMPHGGFVLTSGSTGKESKQLIEYRLKLDSNPEFTSSVLLAAARGVARFAREGRVGAMTLFDMPPAYLSPKSREELLAELL